MTFCIHQIPTGSWCNHCRGVEVTIAPEPTEAERNERRATIRADWAQRLAAMPTTWKKGPVR